MATIDEFESQVFAKEGIRIAIRNNDATLGDLWDYPKTGKPMSDDLRVGDFLKAMDRILGGIPFVIVDGLGQKPWHRTYLGKLRATYLPATKPEEKPLLQLFNTYVEPTLDEKLRKLTTHSRNTRRTART